MQHKPEFIRRCIFRPYTHNCSFTLTLWDLNERGPDGKWRLKYRLNCDGKTVFEGDDFRCGASTPIDSDAAVEAIMGFLTLRPGDTDADYFANYTQAQKDFCAEHAEALGYAVHCRFHPEDKDETR